MSYRVSLITWFRDSGKIKWQIIIIIIDTLQCKVEPLWLLGLTHTVFNFYSAQFCWKQGCPCTSVLYVDAQIVISGTVTVLVCLGLLQPSFTNTHQQVARNRPEGWYATRDTRFSCPSMFARGVSLNGNQFWTVVAVSAFKVSLHSGLSLTAGGRGYSPHILRYISGYFDKKPARWLHYSDSNPWLFFVYQRLLIKLMTALYIWFVFEVKQYD